ncbi:MAG: hypothetical protein ACK4Y5_08135, partial [Acetobacteraceae bacterium]
DARNPSRACRQGQKVTENGCIQAKAALKTCAQAKIAMLNEGFSAACYCLTVMLPNEDFAELVRSGFRVALTPEDITTITERR